MDTSLPTELNEVKRRLHHFNDQDACIHCGEDLGYAGATGSQHCGDLEEHLSPARPAKLKCARCDQLYPPGCKGAQHGNFGCAMNTPLNKDPKLEEVEVGPCIHGAGPGVVHPPELLWNAADVLQQMSTTYRERNAVYSDNFRMVGPMMRVLFPRGVPPEVLHSDQFHLFELILVKLSRFAVSGLSHVDSIHDAAVYAAMIEAILHEQDSSHRR